MPLPTEGKIWMNGQLVEWQDATVHICSHVIHYGSSVFEGIRCYDTAKGPAVLQLRAHMKRLFDSAKIYRSDIPYSLDESCEAVLETIRANDLRSCYIRPVVYRGYGELGVNPFTCPVDFSIVCLNWGRYLGKEAIEQGIDVRIASWARPAPNTLPSLAKAGGNYLNSQLVKMEAIKEGYVEGIVLTTEGYLSEGSGENLFVIRDNILYTTPGSASILPGITRKMVLGLAKELGIEVVEANLPRELLYIADEAFFTGTAAEVSPIRSVDKISIGSGSRGPITHAIQQRFFDILESGDDGGRGWLTFVYPDDAPAETAVSADGADNHLAE